MVCGITGHRRCENMYDRGMKMNYEIWNAMHSGHDTFVVGMAEGADTIAARFILCLREHGYPVRLVALLPYPDFGNHDSERREIISRADVVECTGQTFARWCYDKRDREIVNRSDMIIGMLDDHRARSGTGRTVDYARKKNIPCVIV